MIDSLERVVTTATDVDASWWPFVGLRPEPHEEVTLSLLGKMSAAYGGIAGAVFGALVAVELAVTPLAVVGGAAAGTAVYFVVWGALFQTMWNRRAKRLGRRAQDT